FIDTLRLLGAVTTYTWGSWGDWGSCISNCPDSNTGTKTRTKACIAHITTANHTTTHSVVYIHCGTSTQSHQNTNCSVTCPSRECHHVHNSASGPTSHHAVVISHCNGTDLYASQQSQTRSCHTRCPVPVNGDWGDWTSWSTCSVTTGTGSTERHRSLNVWSDWTAWSQCTVTCGTGEKLRMRHCVNGSRCDGATVDKASCALLPCSVECEGSPASFEKCEMPGCLRGSNPFRVILSRSEYLQIRNSCIIELCCYTINSRKLNNLKRSHLDGGWTGWSNLTSCNSICGMGMQRTLRTCTAPAPANGGSQCTGDSMLSRECDNGPCPSDIKVCDGTLLKDAMRGAQSADFNCYNTSGTDTSGSGSSGIDPKGMISEMCLAPGTDSWIIGVQVSSICSQLPIYSPLASLETGSRKHKYAILLDCFQEILTIATMDCQGAIQKVTVDLEQTPQEYHLLTW
ncbi:SEM5A-like protein, partial [Mya arenaria]